jgi:SagB-type dehydrogenase family enzyme
MWAAQGSTDPRGLRTAPSAGALYPLELYLIATDVKNLKKGVYKYNTRNHELILLSEEDIRIKLAEAALDQDVIRNAPAIIVISAIYDRVTGKYGTRGIRYTDMEAGHTAQNIYLQATSLNLGTVAIGAFDDDNIVKVTGMSKNEKPLYIMPIGKMK